MLVILSSATPGRHDEKGGHHSHLDSNGYSEDVEGDYLIGIQRIPGSMSSGKSVAGLMDGTRVVY